jgi:hypothetical protein
MVPEVKEKEHVGAQSIPEGELVTEPLPKPASFTISV